MEYSDTYELLSLLGYLLLVAGAGVGGYSVGRFHEPTQRQPSQHRTRRRSS